MTYDTWHMTRDMWHVTHDMWHVTHGGGWTFSQNFSSLALTVWERQCFEDWEEKDDLAPHWINEWERCLKNSPGSPGLLKRGRKIIDHKRQREDCGKKCVIVTLLPTWTQVCTKCRVITWDEETRRLKKSWWKCFLSSEEIIHLEFLQLGTWVRIVGYIMTQYIVSLWNLCDSRTKFGGLYGTFKYIYNLLTDPV